MPKGNLSGAHARLIQRKAQPFHILDCPDRSKAQDRRIVMSGKLVSAVGAAWLLLSMGAPAGAANFEVHMLNKGEAGMMVFEPAALKVMPGDTVTFIPTDKSHNAETVKGLAPAGAVPFKGKINETVKVSFDMPGIYVVKCAPHFAMGMVAAVLVGDNPANLAEVKAATLPKKARERIEADLSALGL
jgi:pseudoazurin